MRRPLLVSSVALGSTLMITGAAGIISPSAVETVGDAPTPLVTVVPTEVPTLDVGSEEPASNEIGDPVTDVETVDDVAVPVALELPALSVDAEVVRVGLEDDGAMEIPEDVATVGWYDLGVAPNGTAGSAVLAGHVDSRTQGRGAFFDLRRLNVGDDATVRHDDGTVGSWQVTARTSYPKDEAPLAELFASDGPPRLVLITCGGAFDATARSYDENVVAILEPT